uniref:Transmembrane protein n=1 Tax=Noccaea caerulescens TaxID=107243 RepID=A0A1J3HDL5_NOCCA
MGTRIADGGGENLKTFEKVDALTVINHGNQKPFVSSSPPPSPSISSSLISSTSTPEPVVVEEEEEEFDWVAVEREAGVITDKAPEIDEVEDAFSALRLMFVDDDDDKSEDQVSESEFVDWIEPPLQLCNTRLLQPYMLDRFYDAFHQFQTDPSVQRMVMSLSSDKAVWDAVMNNEVVRELITNAERSEEESCAAADFIRRLFERSAIKIMDAMERVTKYVTDLFSVVPGDETVVLATGAAPVMEKLQMTVLLTVLVLLIVLVTRVTRAR